MSPSRPEGDSTNLAVSINTVLYRSSMTEAAPVSERITTWTLRLGLLAVALLAVYIWARGG